MQKLVNQLGQLSDDKEKTTALSCGKVGEYILVLVTLTKAILPHFKGKASDRKAGTYCKLVKKDNIGNSNIAGVDSIKLDNIYKGLQSGPSMFQSQTGKSCLDNYWNKPYQAKITIDNPFDEEQYNTLKSYCLESGKSGGSGSSKFASSNTCKFGSVEPQEIAAKPATTESDEMQEYLEFKAFMKKRAGQ